MKSRTVSIEKTRKTSVPSDELKNQIDQYVQDTKALHSRVREIRKLQRNECLSDDVVRQYWNEAVERKAHTTDERNRLRFIPAEYKETKHAESGKLGHSELRELRNLQRFKQDVERGKGTKIRADIQEQLQNDANTQLLIKKKVNEAVALKDAHIKLIDMELQSMKKGTKTPANLSVNFDFTELVNLMRGLLSKGQQKCRMTIEEGKIVKLE